MERQCGYDDAVRLTGGAVEIAYRPAGLGTSCPVAAALVLWEWHVVQPAALEHFGEKVVAIEHFGSFSCRRIYGRDEGRWSEHATADAIDVAGFRLEGSEEHTSELQSLMRISYAVFCLKKKTKMTPTY